MAKLSDSNGEPGQVCADCGGDVGDADNEWELCQECYDGGGSEGGDSYCCGQIYEEGEVVCASCGDPL